MAWVRAERSSEAEKNIKRSERRHNDNDGETFDSCAIRLESWHCVLRTYKSNIMPLLWQSCHELHKSRGHVNQQKEVVGREWSLPVCLF